MEYLTEYLANHPESTLEYYNMGISIIPIRQHLLDGDTDPPRYCLSLSLSLCLLVCLFVQCIMYQTVTI
jgi:hypothetical protein